MPFKRPGTTLVWLIVIATAASAGGYVISCSMQAKRGRRRGHHHDWGGYAALIGETPLVELSSLSKATGCRIFAKAEFLNPGGTSKDRIALQMVEEAEEEGLLEPGGVVVEGTSGSTGIALASLCRARGYRCILVMPDDQAEEKRQLLRQFGAEVEVVRTAAIANPQHYYNVAQKMAKEIEGAVFMDQFETPANFNAHYWNTAPEIWEQLEKEGLSPDAFVMSCGTGGTMAGVSCYFKEKRQGIKAILADPPGSSLFNKVKYGVCFAPQQKERGLKKHRYDTIAEGIGLDRITSNFARAFIDDAVRVTDQEALDMAHYVLHKEGLFVGSSTSMNLVASVVAARRMGPGHVLVTVLCDSGNRHLTRFWNRHFVEESFGLRWPEEPPRTLDFIKDEIDRVDQ